MKTFINLSIVFSVLFMLIGCTAIKDWASSPSAVEQSYQAGKVATVAYLTQEDKLEEKQKKAIIAVYEAFDALMSEPTTEPDGTVITPDLTNLKSLLLSKLEGKLNDAEKLIVIEIVDLYINKLKSDINDQNKLIGKTALALLKSFHKGTKDALKDYKLILQ